MPNNPKYQVLQGSILPDSATFTFKSCKCSGGVGTSVPFNYQSNVNISSTAFSNLTPASSPRMFADDAIAGWNVGSSVPFNQSNLDKLAKKFYQEYLNWLSYKYDIVYNGVISPDIDATIDTIDVKYYANDVTTRISGGGLDNPIEQLNHNDITVRCVSNPNTNPPTITESYPFTYFGTPSPAKYAGHCASKILGMNTMTRLDGRMLVVGDGFSVVCNSCPCNQNTICVTISYHCTPGPMSGITIILIDNDGHTFTCITDGTGKCCFENIINGNVTVTATTPTGYIICNSSSSTTVDCNDCVIYNLGFQYNINTETVFFGAFLCFGTLIENCFPSPGQPVTITASDGQTCTMTSLTSPSIGVFIGCNIVFPRTSGCTDYTITYSSPNYTSVVQTLSICDGCVDRFGHPPAPECSQTLFAELNPVGWPNAFCLPNAGCVRPFPATMTVTLPTNPCLSTLSGQTVVLTLTPLALSAAYIASGMIGALPYSIGLTFGNISSCDPSATLSVSANVVIGGAISSDNIIAIWGPGCAGYSGPFLSIPACPTLAGAFTALQSCFGTSSFSTTFPGCIPAGNVGPLAFSE